MPGQQLLVLRQGVSVRQQLARSDDGASAVEYGLLVTGIAGLIVAMVFIFGGFVGNVFTHSCTTVDTQVAAHGGPTSTCG